MKMSKQKRSKRYSISVSGQTYDRVRDVVASVSVQKFVDGILVSALDDPKIMGRVVSKCRAKGLERSSDDPSIR